MAGKLTAKHIEKKLLAEGSPQPGRHTDGDGLHLHVRPDGHATWVLRYRLHERQRDMSLGSYRDVSLKAAREAAAAARLEIKAGRDPNPRATTGRAGGGRGGQPRSDVPRRHGLGDRRARGHLAEREAPLAVAGDARQARHPHSRRPPGL